VNISLNYTKENALMSCVPVGNAWGGVEENRPFTDVLRYAQRIGKRHVEFVDKPNGVNQLS